MIVQALAFYVFAFVAIASGVMVISSRNPVHSVLFLILAFFNAAGLFVLMGAEFLAMILVVVYVGAVAVLFLFVVMMLDINFVKPAPGLPAVPAPGRPVGLILLVELAFIVGSWAVSPVPAGAAARAADRAAGRGPQHQAAIGEVLYTRYAYLFQAAGLILLVAMIGAIVLTLRHREGVRRQKISDQVSRRREDAVEVKKVPTGSGV